jgi:DNA polymerase-3 subunit delta
MKITPQQTAGFLKNPTTAFVLVYGPDAGRVSEIASEIVGRDRQDGIDVVTLDGMDLGSDTGPILEAATTAGLFSAGSNVRVRNAGDRLAKGMKEMLGLPGGTNRVVLEAGDLTPRSPLRKLFETARNAAAIPCYLPESRDLIGLARSVLGAAKIRLDPAAERWLGECLPRDSLFARRELEKLALFLGDRQECLLDHVTAVIGDGAEAEMDEAVLAAIDGDAPAAMKAVRRLQSSGTPAIALLRRSQQLFQRLHRARAAYDGGLTARDAVAELKPPVFFRHKPRLERQVAAWGTAQIEKALGLLTRTESLCKQTGYPEDNLVAHAILELALAGRAASKR